MPKVYRVMRREGDFPAIGESAATLGVRIPQDIQPDEGGKVAPGVGGMSVSPSLADLPFFLVPKRLAALHPSARGSNANFVWSYGEGAFVASYFAASLLLRPDPTHLGHGFVEPERQMILEEYQDALVATRQGWRVAEE